MIALGILLQGIDFLINKNFKKFLMIVLLASMFHITSLIFLCLYPLFKLKGKRSTIILFVIVFCTLFFVKTFLNDSIRFLLNFSDRYKGYEISLNGSNNMIHLFWPSVIILISILFLKKWKTNVIMKHFFKVILIGFVITFTVARIDVYLMRLALYFSAFNMFFIPALVKKSGLNYRIPLYLFFLLLFVTQLYIMLKHNDNGVVPYSFK
jgi:hypothetical protein